MHIKYYVNTYREQKKTCRMNLAILTKCIIEFRIAILCTRNKTYNILYKYITVIFVKFQEK